MSKCDGSDLERAATLRLRFVALGRILRLDSGLATGVAGGGALGRTGGVLESFWRETSEFRMVEMALEPAPVAVPGATTGIELHEEVNGEVEADDDERDEHTDELETSGDEWLIAAPTSSLSSS